METGLYRPDTSYISQITYFRLEFEGVLPKPAAKLTSTHQREGVMSNVPPHFLLLSCCLSFKTDVTAWTLWSISNWEIFHITVLCTLPGSRLTFHHPYQTLCVIKVSRRLKLQTVQNKHYTLAVIRIPAGACSSQQGAAVVGLQWQVCSQHINVGV